MAKIREVCRNRNLATPEVTDAVRDAIRDVLEIYDIDRDRVEDFEPFVSNVVYALVKEHWEGD